MSAESLDTQAANLIKAGHYSAAIRLYTKLINASIASPDIIRFDRRASCYENTGQLQEALEDAKRMLQIDKHNIKGYLRAGKIYQLMNKDESALKYYDRGLTNTPDTAPLRKVLSQMKTAVEKRIRGSRIERDPFTLLPVEIVWQIFSNCSMADCVRASRVSKAWHRTITKSPYFWQYMDSTGHAKVPNSKALETYVIRSRGTLKTLRIEADINKLVMQRGLGSQLTNLRCGLNEGSYPALRTMKQLQVLDLAGPSPFDRCPKFQQAAQIISALPNLQTFSAHILATARRLDTFAEITAPNLQTLLLVFPIGGQMLDGASLTDAAQWKMPKLETFFLAGIGALLWPDERRVAWPPTLKKIQCTFDLRTGQNVVPGALIEPAVPDHLEHFYWRTTTEMPKTKSGKYPPLKTLIFHDLKSFGRPVWMDSAWASFGQTVTRLEFSHCETESEKLQFYVRCFPRLQWLGCSHAKYVDGDVLNAVGDTCSTLRTIDLGVCNRIESAAVLRLTKLQPDLRRLIIDKGVLAPDVLTWLRKTRGVSVTQLPNSR